MRVPSGAEAPEPPLASALTDLNNPRVRSGNENNR